VSDLSPTPVVTHFLKGRRGGLTEELILHVLEEATKRPASILAHDVDTAHALAQQVRERAPSFEVTVRGTLVNVARKK
jgi:hypothetical protein